jgi:hypothetical protein
MGGRWLLGWAADASGGDRTHDFGDELQIRELLSP